MYKNKPCGRATAIIVKKTVKLPNEHVMASMARQEPPTGRSCKAFTPTCVALNTTLHIPKARRRGGEEARKALSI